jgi:8-oxo-dGTP diphosphatase
MPNSFPRNVTLAVLYQSGRFLMQLRDDKPDILYPGRWGLFGGHIEAGETPEVGVKREVQEEITYSLEQAKFFSRYDDREAHRHIFYAPLTVPLDCLILREGWDFALVPPEAIARGYYYSPKPNEERPLGSIHQKILLDFIKAGLK